MGWIKNDFVSINAEKSAKQNFTKICTIILYYQTNIDRILLFSYIITFKIENFFNIYTLYRLNNLYIDHSRYIKTSVHV